MSKKDITEISFMLKLYINLVSDVSSEIPSLWRNTNRQHEMIVDIQ